MMSNLSFSNQQNSVTPVSNYSSYLSIPNSNQTRVYVLLYYGNYDVDSYI